MDEVQIDSEIKVEVEEVISWYSKKSGIEWHVSDVRKFSREVFKFALVK